MNTYLIIQKEPSSESLVHTRNLTGPQRAVVCSASTLFALNNEAKSMDPSEASAILATLASAFGDLSLGGPLPERARKGSVFTGVHSFEIVFTNECSFFFFFLFFWR